MESVLRTELLEVIPKTLADACMRHGYCTAELIVWYVMKQLILPPDINEVTMQKEILTPPKVSPTTLDQACAWLKEMQHRLNPIIKTKQNVHPRTTVAFVNDTLSGITQYYRTLGNVWDSLYTKHQLHESHITLDRVYTMLARYHPRRQPGRCAICGSTRHYTSQCTHPIKPKLRMPSGMRPHGSKMKSARLSMGG